MDRSIPMFNRVIIEKMQKKNLDLHHKRLEKIRTHPRKQAHSILRVQNAKGTQLQQQRRTEIEKQNIILFNKMNRIMNRTGIRMSTQYNPSKDHKNREFNDRIYEENRAIVNRIGNQKPTISTKKLYEERVKHERLLRFMGRYPYRTHYGSKGQNSLDQMDQTTGSHQDIIFKEPAEKITSDSKPQTAAVNIRSKSYHDSGRNQVMPKIERDYSQKIPLYRKRREVDSVPSIVEVNRLFKQYEFKLTNLTTKKQYNLYLSEQQGNSLLTDFDYDYHYIANCFKVISGKLIIELDEKPIRTQSYTQNRNKTQQETHSLLNEHKLKNFRLKEQQYQDQAKPASIRNVTEANTKPSYQLEDLGAYHHSDTLDPKKENAFQDHVKIYYEEALDQQLQEA